MGERIHLGSSRSNAKMELTVQEAYGGYSWEGWRETPSDCSVRLIPAKGGFGGWSSIPPAAQLESPGQRGTHTEHRWPHSGCGEVWPWKAWAVVETKGGSASIFLEGKPKMCPVCLVVSLVCTLLFLRHVFTVDQATFKPVVVFLPLPHECWDWGFALPCSACASFPN